MSNESGYTGFEDLSKELEKYMHTAENSIEILLAGAEAAKKDLDKLTKPMSRIRKSGYTHLVDEFPIEKKEKEVVNG